MSYSFDGSNDTMTGTFASTYAEPVTIAAFIKITDHPMAIDQVIGFGNSSSSNNGSYIIRTTATDNEFSGVSTSDIGGVVNCTEIQTIDGTWTGLVMRITNESSRDIFVGSLANTTSNTTANSVANALQFIRLGESFGAVHDFTGLIAEAAIWDSALSDADITSYLAGTSASTIDAANLIGYWPLSASNTTQANLGVDADGDLSVTGATFSSDHPTISGGGSGTTVSPNAAGMSV